MSKADLPNQAEKRGVFATHRRTCNERDPPAQSIEQRIPSALEDWRSYGWVCQRCRDEAGAEDGASLRAQDEFTWDVEEEGMVEAWGA